MLENGPSKRTPLYREVIETADGSSTLVVPDLGETYHSSKGALTESVFVFIEHGLLRISKPKINILEIGMGTGLNVLLTLLNAGDKKIEYHTLEPHPLIEDEYMALNYCAKLECPQALFTNIHTAPWNENTNLTSSFQLYKHNDYIENHQLQLDFDLIYFDAFAPSKQIGPWQSANLEKIYAGMQKDGLLVTYCAQGQFKRDLKRIGFIVENPRGPLGKWEMTLAYKA